MSALGDRDGEDMGRYITSGDLPLGTLAPRLHTIAIQLVIHRLAIAGLPVNTGVNTAVDVELLTQQYVTDSNKFHEHDAGQLLDSVMKLSTYLSLRCISFTPDWVAIKRSEVTRASPNIGGWQFDW